MRRLYRIAFLAMALVQPVFARSSDDVRTWAALRPRPAGISLLLRVDGAASGVDRVRVQFPDRRWTASARLAVPSSWSLATRRARAELRGPASPLPLYLRIDIDDPGKLDPFQVTVWSGRRQLSDEQIAPQQAAAIEVARNAAEIAVLPPLMTARETIELTLLDAHRTNGEWSLGSERAQLVPSDNAGRPLLRVRVPAGAPDLVFVNPWGETTVQAPVLAQSRMVPATLPTPSAPRLGACGVRTLSDQAVCVCGWFPTEESKRAILIDGAAASGPPLASSQRSVCLSAAPGTHALTGKETSGFDPRNRVDVQAIRMRRTSVGSLRQGQSATLTWTITGTHEPMWIRLNNTTPGVGTLDGGEAQRAVTSGGEPNAVSRSVTGLAPGTFGVIAEVEEPLSAREDQEYPRLIAETFRRELRRVADAAEAASREVQGREGLLALLNGVESDLRRSLPFPELAAFQDALAEKLDRLRRNATDSARGRGVYYLVADDAEQSVLAGFVQWLRDLADTSPIRRICVVTDPTGADVKLYPASFPSDFQTTRSIGPLTLFLGRYAYEITRTDYVKSTGFVNLLRNAEQVVECPLVRTAGDPSACRLVAELSTERCP